VDGHEHTAEEGPHGPDEPDEVLDGEIVQVAPGPLLVSDTRAVAPSPSGWNAAPVQTAVAAATGFIAGAATLALLRRYGMGRAAVRQLDVAREEPLRRGAGEPAPLRGGTYLVSIRTLQTPQ
jgi:hypothetical protein